MPANTDEISRVKEFLDALTELSRRTGVVVWGCNCHDSPALLVDAEEFRGPWDADGWYVVDYNPDVEPDSPWSRRFGEVRWRPRADDAANEAGSAPRTRGGAVATAARGRPDGQWVTEFPFRSNHRTGPDQMMNDDTDRARAPLEPKTAGNVAAVAAEHREHTMAIYYDTNARAMGLADLKLSQRWTDVSHAALSLRDALERVQDHLHSPARGG